MKKILCLGLLAISLVSCSIALPGIATGAKSVKEGVAKKTVWLGLALSPVDVSIEKAAKNGNIKKIATVDTEVKAGLFSTTYKTIVTGE